MVFNLSKVLDARSFLSQVSTVKLVFYKKLLGRIGFQNFLD